MGEVFASVRRRTTIPFLCGATLAGALLCGVRAGGAQAQEHSEAEVDEGRDDEGDEDAIENEDSADNDDESADEDEDGEHDVDAPIAVTKGAEMRLIEAEHALTMQDVQGAIDLINRVRMNAGAVPRPPLPADAGQAQQTAWRYLKEERAIVMWLEARRGGDFFRWKSANPSFDASQDHILDTMNQNAIRIDPKENSDILVQGRAICFQLGETIRQTNPNLPPQADPALAQ